MLIATAQPVAVLYVMGVLSLGGSALMWINARRIARKQVAIYRTNRILQEFWRLTSLGLAGGEGYWMFVSRVCSLGLAVGGILTLYVAIINSLWIAP